MMIYTLETAAEHRGIGPGEVSGRSWSRTDARTPQRPLPAQRVLETACHQSSQSSAATTRSLCGLMRVWSIVVNTYYAANARLLRPRRAFGSPWLYIGGVFTAVPVTLPSRGR